MQKILHVITRSLGVLFAILFVITSVIALPLTIINQQIFNANFYKNTLVEQNIYARVPEIVGVALTGGFSSNHCTQSPLACTIDSSSPELKACLTTALGLSAYQEIGSGQRIPTRDELQISQPCLDQYGTPQNESPRSGSINSGNVGGMPPFFQNLTSEDWQTMLTILLPEDDLRSMTESLLDQMVAYLNGATDKVTIPLEKVKERLAGPGGADLIMQLVSFQPPCTDQDLEQMLNGTINGNLVLVLCKPPEVMIPIVTLLFPELLKMFVPQIPDMAIIIEPTAPGVPSSVTGPLSADLVATLRTLRLMMRLSPLFPLVFLLFVTLFTVRSLQGWLRWWGIPIFISAAIAIGLGILASPALTTAWDLLMVPRIPILFPPNIADIGIELLRLIVNSIAKSVIFWAIIFLVLGLAAWIASYFIKTKNEPDVLLPPPMPAL